MTPVVGLSFGRRQRRCSAVGRGRHRPVGLRRKRSRIRFSELSGAQRVGLLVLAAVEVGLLIAAELDIQRRPADQVVGEKIWWRGAALINVVGPLSYFRWGRRRSGPDEAGLAQRDGEGARPPHQPL